MSGQVQISEINKDSLFDKFNNTLLKQADLLYLKEKFALDVDYSQSKAFHAYLMQEVLCTDNCDIITFLNKKFEGKDIKLRNKKEENKSKIAEEYEQVVNNYYIYNNDVWVETEW